MSKRLGLFLFWTIAVSALALSALQSQSAFADKSKQQDLNSKDLNVKEIRDRLNKIFYWQLSDELKLSPQQEKAVVEILEKSQLQRDEALSQREEALQALQKLSKTASLDQTRPHLERYSLALQKLSNLERDEYNALKEAIGEELLGRFYVIREDVTSRVRKALKK